MNADLEHFEVRTDPSQEGPDHRGARGVALRDALIFNGAADLVFEGVEGEGFERCVHSAHARERVRRRGLVAGKQVDDGAPDGSSHEDLVGEPRRDELRLTDADRME